MFHLPESINQISQVEVVVHALLLERLGAAGALWYAIRGLDEKGTGRANISLSELGQVLKRKPDTLRRYLNKGYLFNKVIKRGDRYTVYYCSLEKVAIQLGLESWGASGHILIKHLVDYKVVAAELQAQALQTNSRFLARMHKKKTQRLLNAVMLSSADATSVLPQGVWNYGNKVLYNSDVYPVFGVNQKKIATCLERCVRTVQNRLKYTVRRQQFITFDGIEAEYEAAVWEDQESWEMSSRKYIRFGGVLHKAYTNIYEPSYMLTSKRMRKTKYTQKYDSVFKQINQIRNLGLNKVETQKLINECICTFESNQRGYVYQLREKPIVITKRQSKKISSVSEPISVVYQNNLDPVVYQDRSIDSPKSSSPWANLIIPDHLKSSPSALGISTHETLTLNKADGAEKPARRPGG